jgi:TIR domain
MYPFRVFLSYAHADRAKIEHMDTILHDMGLLPVWDKNVAAGTAFDDEIRRRIAHAHAFMPLITLNSRERPWVHQEIGYALGIGVPVVPVAVGALPEGLLSEIQAICIRDDLSDLQDGIKQAGLEALLLPSDAQGELGRVNTNS